MKLYFYNFLINFIQFEKSFLNFFCKLLFLIKKNQNNKLKSVNTNQFQKIKKRRLQISQKKQVRTLQYKLTDKQ